MARTEGVLNNGEILTVEELDQVSNNSMLFKNNTGSYIALPLGASGTVPTSNGPTVNPTMQIGGVGDMLKSVYDPTNKNGDTFSQDNMTSGTTNKNYTATEQTKLAGIAAGAQVNVPAPVTSVSGKTGVVTLVKGDVGLSNVDNTTDLSKPISTLTQTALNSKQPAGTYATGTGSANGTNTGDITLAGTPNYITIVGQTITRALINLTSHITGILGVVNGGTGLSSPGTSGNVLTSDGTNWLSSVPAGGGSFPITIYSSASQNFTANTQYTFIHSLGVTQVDVIEGKYKIVITGTGSGKGIQAGDTYFSPDYYGANIFNSIQGVYNNWTIANATDKQNAQWQSNDIDIYWGTISVTGGRLHIQQMY